MATITVPLEKDLQDFIRSEIREGHAATKTHVVRQALRALREQRAFDRIREAEDDKHAGRVYTGSLSSLLKALPE